MNIIEFNKSFGTNLEQFRLVEIESYVRHNGHHVRRFNLQQYCPTIDSYCRMLVPSHRSLNFTSQIKTPLSDDECVIKDSLLEDIENPPKYIIVCEEKYSTNYFHACTTEVIGRTAIHILKERAQQGFYYELDLTDREDPLKPTKKEDDFPHDPTFAQLAREQWEEYDRVMRRQLEEKNFRVRFNKAMNDYSEAVSLLCERNDCCEYEGFRFEVLGSIS